MEALIEGLKSNDSLTTLDLTHILLNEADEEMFCRALYNCFAYNKSLKIVNISENYISEKGNK